MTKAELVRLGRLAGCAAWPASWTPPSRLQVRLLARLGARRDAFVAAVDVLGVQRVVVLAQGRAGSYVAREYVLLRDGRMRRVEAGVPYELPVAA